MGYCIGNFLIVSKEHFIMSLTGLILFPHKIITLFCLSAGTGMQQSKFRLPILSLRVRLKFVWLNH